MKPALTRITTLVVACGALAYGAHAGVNTYSIGFNFGTNEPNGLNLGSLASGDVAGVPAVAQANWNNLGGASGGVDTGIVANQNGNPFATSVGITWNSAGTWASSGRGEPNGDNYFPTNTPNRILNTGYLDTGNATTTQITITNLPSDLTTPGYDVYVYAIGGVQGRGGSYRILNAADQTELKPYQLGSSANAPTNYVMDTGESHNNESGTYLVFRNLTAPGIIVESTTTANPLTGTPRAPVNAIQLVAASATGEAEPATALDITPSTGQIQLSWTPGAGSSGTLVVARAGRRVTAQPVDGTTYTGNATFGLGDNLGDDNIGSPNYVVYSGPGNSVTISNVFGSTNYHFAVYSFTGNNYTLLNPPTGNATPPANVVSLQFNVPSNLILGSARNARVLANYDDGGVIDVTGTSTLTSSAPAVVTFIPGPKAAALSLGNATLTASYLTFNTQQVVSVANMSMTHQYSMSGAFASTNIEDSVGNADGVVVTADLQSAQDGAGMLILSGGTTNYVELPSNLVSDYGAITIETWATDNGNVNWARLFDFGVDTARYMFLSPSAAGNGTVRAAITLGGAGAEQTLSGGNAGAGEHHYVWVIEGASRTGRLYVDGRQVAVNTNMTLTPEDIGPAPNIWLGRSQYAADGYFVGTINEFRTYNGPLDPMQIALNAATGPNTVVTDPGACTGISLLLNPSMTAGDVQQATVNGIFANIGSPVNITSLPETTYSSSNTNIVRVSATGVVTAVGPGSATVTASAFGQNSQVMITVTEQPIVLNHRYSFTADGTDSVSGFNAALIGQAHIENGQVVLDGVTANNSYVQLPANLFSDYNSLSLEIWFTDDNSGNWARVWDLGNDTGNYLFLTVRPNNTINARTAIRTSAVGEQVVNFRRPSQGAEHHIVYTQDAITQTARIYHNGVLVATNTVTLQPREMGPTGQNRLGRSQFADPYFRGSINEFRIWRGAITPTQVALSYGLGPDNLTTVTNPGAVTSVSVSLTNMVVGRTQPARAVVNFASVSGVNMAPFASNWISSDISVAKVDQDGVVTGVGPAAPPSARPTAASPGTGRSP